MNELDEMFPPTKEDNIIDRLIDIHNYVDTLDVDLSVKSNLKDMLNDVQDMVECED